MNRRKFLKCSAGCAALVAAPVSFAAASTVKSKFLTLEQLRELVRKGYSIGWHSVDNPSMNPIDRHHWLSEIDRLGGKK